MRTHAQILDAAGQHSLAALLAPHLPDDLLTIQKRVRAWAVTDSIPGEYWALLEKLGIATVVELAEDAHERGIRKLEERAKRRAEQATA